MTKFPVARAVLALMAIYDGVLGIAFLIAGPRIFDSFGITHPNHWGYVHFIAALLIIFALMFLAASANPRGNRNLLPYCILLKFAYSGVVAYHWFIADGLPWLWKPFAFIDIGMALILLWLYVVLGRAAARA
jgi:hypothetical protein